MGFGYLFLGYLLAFLLKFAADNIGAGPLVFLVGTVLIAVGVRLLSDYEKTFRFSYIPLGLLTLSNGYQIICMIAGWTRKTPAWMTADVNNTLEWCHVAFIVLFHVLLAIAVARLTLSIGLPKTASFALCNLILLGAWVIFAVVLKAAPLSSKAIRILTAVQVLTQISWTLFDLGLFLSCMKNIAPQGEEDQPPKRYRWDLLNKIGDRFFGEHERAVEKQKAETEVYLRRRKEKREQKSKSKKEE